MILVANELRMFADLLDAIQEQVGGTADFTCDFGRFPTVRVAWTGRQPYRSCWMVYDFRTLQNLRPAITETEEQTRRSDWVEFETARFCRVVRVKAEECPA